MSETSYIIYLHHFWNVSFSKMSFQHLGLITMGRFNRIYILLWEVL
jgi:hypothetical protein